MRNTSGAFIRKAPTCCETHSCIRPTFRLQRVGWRNMERTIGQHGAADLDMGQDFEISCRRFFGVWTKSLICVGGARRGFLAAATRSAAETERNSPLYVHRASTEVRDRGRTFPAGNPRGSIERQSPASIPVPYLEAPVPELNM
jgi:hypothetical protein